jgi:3-oxoacyl-[acyl-carrier protein] reductase
MIDVSKREDVDQVIEATVEDYKRIDILINNAGIAQKLGNIYRLSKEDWDQLIAVNLTGVINCIRAVSKYMVRQRYGKIVNISSVVGLTGGLGLVGYSASKAGIVGVTKSAAKEFAKYKINVNCIAPGFIDTDLWRILKDDQRKRLTELILFGRMGTPMDIAHCVCFLASDLSNYITGSVIPVDGGLTLGNY